MGLSPSSDPPPPERARRPRRRVITQILFSNRHPPNPPCEPLHTQSYLYPSDCAPIARVSRTCGGFRRIPRLSRPYLLPTSCTDRGWLASLSHTRNHLLSDTKSATWSRNVPRYPPRGGVSRGSCGVSRTGDYGCKPLLLVEEMACILASELPPSTPRREGELHLFPPVLWFEWDPPTLGSGEFTSRWGACQEYYLATCGPAGVLL